MTVELMIDEELYDFYKKIGTQNGCASAEWTMADLLFKLAAEASENALRELNKKSEHQ